MYDDQKTLMLFRTLPKIRTGANLTLTILVRLFNLRMFDKARNIYINWDGSRDNVNYTCLYSLIHFLVCAERSGWPLRSFILLRLPVGHTHNHLDATFSLISKASVYNFEERVIVIGRVGDAGKVNYTEKKSWVTDNALYVKKKLVDKEKNPTR